jgi:ribose 5-phosphate isomerase B
MKLFIASDHAGVELKSFIQSSLPMHEWEDLGTHSSASVDYPDFADALVEAMKRFSGSKEALGILICGSGVGVSIAANRHPEIRAVLASSTEVARLGREHNHANVLCLGSRIITSERALEIIDAFLSAKPDQGERHLNRIQKLSKLC